jgi:hypothetical protein
MTVANGYCTLADFKAYITPPGQALNMDFGDDAVIEDIISRASRRVDALTGRRFYPRVETRKFDTPYNEQLWLDDDLLEIITLTNGDLVAIASTDYIFKPQNEYPKYCVQLRDTATIYFTPTSASSYDEAISLAGIWGYRERYSADGWVSGSTLNEVGNITTAVLSFTATSGSAFARDQIIRLDNEFMIVTDVTGNEITVAARGANGSTAAIHLNAVAIKYWQQQDDIAGLTLEIARIMYRARYGENVETTAYTTPAGVVITPRSLPPWAQEVISRYQRLV